MTKLTTKHVLVFLFLLGTCLRLIDVWRPMDGSSLSAWHAGDVASVARNYYREGMNLFHPRIDWRGNGPGYTEMEFPILPWLAAVFYQAVGFKEEILRAIPFCFSLLGMWAFFGLACRLLPVPGSVAAVAFFAVHPLLVEMARSIQPGSLMLAFYLIAIYGFVRWLDEREPRHYALAWVATALTILVKATSAHIGFLFAALVLQRMGWRAIKERALWLFAILSLTPGILWYTYAHGFWLTYGNSLGVSNESHWVGSDFFLDPYFITGIVRAELLFWSLPGLLVGVWGVWASKRTPLFGTARLGLYWLASAFFFYVITARTSADPWASYYHIFSIGPMALLFGVGIASAAPLLQTVRSRSMAALIAVFAALGAVLLPLGDLDRFASDAAIVWSLFGVGAPLVAAMCLASGRDAAPVSDGAGAVAGAAAWPPIVRFAMAAGIAGLMVATFFWHSRRLIWDLEGRTELQAKYECVPAVREVVVEPGLLLASGGICTDHTGQPVAFNAPEWFYWLDRKGFNVCIAEQSLEEVQRYAAEGAEYFVAEDYALAQKPGFREALQSEFPLLYEGCRISVFDLP